MQPGLTKRQLLIRGWSQSQIRRFFPEPLRGPFGQPLYAASQIEQIEASAEFQAVRLANRQRTNTTQRASAVRRDKTVASAVEIQVPILAWDALACRACEHYNSRKPSRFPAASMRSDASFLHRICINYLRHELTAYHGGLQALGGRAGDKRAQAALRARFLDAIAAAYPLLRPACEEARSRRHDLVEVFIPNQPQPSSGRRSTIRRFP